MDPTSVSTVSGLLDKYGPMGAALIIVSVAFLGFVWKVLPLVTESHGRRLDSLIEAFKNAVSGFNKRMADHETTATGRHGEIIAGIGEIKEGIGEIKERLPDKHKKGGDHAAHA